MNDSASMTTSSVVLNGDDRLLQDASDLIEGKRVGVLTNHTGRLIDGRSIIDVIAESDRSELAALYGPEHGITGNTPDGEVVDHGRHPRHDVHVYSLYGKTHKPTTEMLDGIDVLVCDIQDVGARFYTFISTIALALEAAAEHRIPFVILDRPNPIRGIGFDGPVRVPSLKSFVGWMPIPVTHGMTIGELAFLWNNNGWLANGVQARLEIVRMEGWKRTMWYDETGLTWNPPSPNMPKLETAIIYPGMCFVEGTSISEGRGTENPFQVVGAPWADPEKIMKELSGFETSGVMFSPAEFTPREIPGAVSEPKFEGSLCRGLQLSVVNRDAVHPLHLGIAVLAAFKRAHPSETIFRNRRFDILTGTPDVRHQLERGAHPAEICAGWKDELEAFGLLREQHLLY